MGLPPRLGSTLSRPHRPGSAMKQRHACDACLVRHSGVCRALPDDALQRVSRLTLHRRVPAGRMVVLPADKPDSVATIVSGVLKLVRSLEDGRQQIVALHFPGDFVAGPLGDVDQAVAATEVDLCCLEQDQLASVTEAYPRLLTDLFRRALADLDAAREWMLLLGRKTAEERVASFLVLVAERTQPEACARAGGPVALRVPISRTDTADFLGLTIETVSRQIHRLKDAGIIQVRRQRDIRVPELDRLRREAGQAAI